MLSVRFPCSSLWADKQQPVSQCIVNFLMAIYTYCNTSVVSLCSREGSQNRASAEVKMTLRMYVCVYTACAVRTLTISIFTL